MRAAVVIAAVVATAGPAAAQPGDTAAAEALYQRARALMDDGKHAEACPLLEESLALDRGTGTLWHLGRCYEETDRLASAWATFHELAAEAKRQGEPRKERAALDRAAALDDRLARLTIVVADEVAVPGLVVARDGSALGDAVWGTAVPVDAGEHTLSAEAPGHRAWSATITIANGERKTLDLPALEPLPTGGDAGPWNKIPDRDPPPPWYRDTVGWVLVGAGVGLAAGGLGSLVHAGALDDDAEMQTDLDERDRLFDRADSFRLAGGTLLAVGAATAVAGALKLWITPAPEVRIGRKSIAIAISGRF